jgi:hypothetical protein
MYFGFTGMIAVPGEDAKCLEPEETMSTLSFFAIYFLVEFYCRSMSLSRALK